MEHITNFHFLRPLWLLAIFPLMFIVWFMLRKNLISRSWKAVCDSRLLPYLLVNANANKVTWPLYLLAITALIAIIAIAGPAWRELPQPVYRTQSSLIIVLDMSQSMDATDVKPSRLARARHKILDILHKRNEGQTALIVYAQEAFVVSPLTDDTKTIASLVSSLGSELMPNQGSQPKLGVKKAVELLQQAGVNNGDILLVTDGLGEARNKEILDQLAGRGHRLSVLAVGTEAGAPIQLNQGGFLKDRSGAIVVPKFNERPLRDLAHQNGGRYARLVTNDSDIEYLLKQIENIPMAEKQDADNKRLNIEADQWREEGPWLLLVLIPFVALAFRRGWLAVCLLVIFVPIPKPGYALSWEELWNNKNQRGVDAFEKGQHDQAAKLFKNEQWQAAAHYKAGEFEKALELFDKSSNSEALYNKGNVLAKLGRLEDAIRTYEQVLEKDPKHEDAAYNKNLLEEHLKQQENQQGDQEQDKQQQDDSGKDSDQANQSGEQEQQQNSAQQQNQGDSQQGSNADNAQQSDTNEMQNQSSASQQNDNSQQQQQNNEAQQSLLEDEQQQSQQDNNSVAKQQKDENPEKQQQVQTSQTQEMEQQQAEIIRANEQWLRRIPDDPGGLLRRKFRYQSQINPQQNAKDEKPW